MEKEIKEFIKNNCDNCKETCEKGIYTSCKIIKCGDTGKFIERKK